MLTTIKFLEIKEIEHEITLPEYVTDDELDVIQEIIDDAETLDQIVHDLADAEFIINGLTTQGKQVDGGFVYIETEDDNNG